MTAKKKIATVATIAVLAITGTAMAAGGGPGGILGDDDKQEFAQDLAGQLDGVSPVEVSEALDAVAEERMQEHRAEMADAIAAELDGVDAEQVSDALAKHEKQMREGFESGERPEMGSLVTTLSDELGKSEEEVQTALEAVGEKKAAEHEADALQRLDEAVEDGEISEEQADQIRERIESGGGFRPGHGPGGPGGPGFGPGGPGGTEGPAGHSDGASTALPPASGSAA